MLDWADVRGLDWDEGNSGKSIDKHSVSQAEAEQVCFNQPLWVKVPRARSAAPRAPNAAAPAVRIVPDTNTVV